MQQDTSSQPTSRVWFTLLVIFIGIAAAVYGALFLLARVGERVAKEQVKPASTVAVSDFSFTGAPGWTKGPSNATSMALFHTGTDGCFVSAEYKTGTVDVNAAVQKVATDVPEGYTATPLPIQPLVLRTNEGTKLYQLHAYNETNGTAADQTLMHGMEVGYVTLSSGYIELQGHCNTADELASTPAALEAYTFTKH